MMIDELSVTVADLQLAKAEFEDQLAKHIDERVKQFEGLYGLSLRGIVISIMTMQDTQSGLSRRLHCSVSADVRLW